MKKIIILFSFCVVSSNVIANDSIYCKNKNDDYIFKYTYDDKTNVFNYQVKRKDNKEFLLYQRINLDIPSEFGFKLYQVDKAATYDVEKKSKENLIFARFFNLYNNFFSTVIFVNIKEPSYEIPLSEKKFKKIKMLENYININKAIDTLRFHIPENQRYGYQKIIFKITAPLDNEVNECIDFSTEEFNYNFGSKTIYYIKYFFRILVVPLIIKKGNE